MNKEKKLIIWQWTIFCICWIGYASIYFGRVNLSIALPEIQDVFQYSKSQLGLISSIFFWIYGIGKLINGIIGDKVSGKIFVFWGLLIAGLSNVLFGFSTSLLMMIIIWAINGYFQSGLWGPMANVLTRWFPHHKQSIIAIALSTSMIAGYILGWGLSGKLLVEMGWQAAFWVPGITLIIFAFIWLLFSKDHPKDIGLRSPNVYLDKESNISVEKLTLKQSIIKGKMWYIILAAFAQGIVKDGIAIWAPIFLMETQHIDLEKMIGFILMIPLINFIGIIFAANLNTLFKQNEKLTSIALLFLGAIFLLGLIAFGQRSTMLSLLFLGLCSAAMFGVNTLILGVFPMKFSKYGTVSSVVGFLDFCSYITTGIGLAMTGFFIDRWGWNGVLIFWMVVSLIGLVSLFVSHLKSPVETEDINVAMLEGSSK